MTPSSDAKQTGTTPLRSTATKPSKSASPRSPWQEAPHRRHQSPGRPRPSLSSTPGTCRSSSDPAHVAFQAARIPFLLGLIPSPAGRGAATAATSRGGSTPSAPGASGLTATAAHNVKRSAGRAASQPARPPLSQRSHLTAASRSATALHAAPPADPRALFAVDAPSFTAASRTTDPVTSRGPSHRPPAAHIRTPVNASHLNTTSGTANHPLAPPNRSDVAVSQRPDGAGQESQSRPSRAKTKHGKDAGRSRSSATGPTEDAARRRFAAVEGVAGSTERTHPVAPHLRLSPVASAGTSRGVPASPSHPTRPAREAGRKEEN